MRELTEMEMYNVVCANCEKGDELTQDALCVWCQRCGPSYPVRPRGFSAGRALLAEARDG